MITPGQADDRTARGGQSAVPNKKSANQTAYLFCRFIANPSHSRRLFSRVSVYRIAVGRHKNVTIGLGQGLFPIVGDLGYTGVVYLLGTLVWVSVEMVDAATRY
jgi:hypothetical protein